MPAGENTFGRFRQSLALASRFDSRRLIQILALNTTSALLQTIGFFSIIPFLYLATNLDSQTATLPVAFVNDLLGLVAWPYNVVCAGIAFVTLTAIAHLVSLVTAYKTEMYLSAIMRDLRLAVFSAHVNLDYPDIARLDHVKLEKLLHEDIDMYMDDVLDPALDIIVEALFLLFLLSGLLLFAPVITLSILLLLIIYFATAHLLLGNVLQKGSIRIDQLFTRLYTTTRESISDLRYIAIHGAAEHHTSQLRKTSNALAVLGPRLELWGLLPRPIIEVLITVIVVAVISLALLRGDSLTTMVPLIGSTVYALYRIMPSMQSMFKDISRVRTFGHVTGNIAQGLAVKQSKSAANAASACNTPGNKLVLDAVSFQHDTQQPLLEDINLTLLKGQHIGIVGESGAGKSTFLDILLLLQPVSGGSIHNDGYLLTPEDGVAWRQHVGYVAQQVVLSGATVADNIAYGVDADQRNHDLMVQSARTAGIHFFIENQLTECYETSIGDSGMQLSGGQRQRIGLARALYRRPDILVLDEATSALDHSTEESILHNIRTDHPAMTTIFVAHRASSLATCDKIYKLQNGQLSLCQKV
ncbi:MAG: ATP-binding cassette domain-containing protein [Granulosicoccus sp.]